VKFCRDAAMCGPGYRHYHPDIQRKFSEFAPVRPIPGSVCALVVSEETRKGPTPRHCVERLSTERTMGGWLAERSGFELLVVGTMLGTATDTTIRTPRENSAKWLIEANFQPGLRACSVAYDRNGGGRSRHLRDVSK
jgi:hypothetical protein